MPPLTRPLTNGYYNGSLLTITRSRTARGQSARIVDYAYVGDQKPISDLTAQSGNPNGVNNTSRFASWPSPAATASPLASLPRCQRSRPASSRTHRRTFLVNGRAFNGTGVGYRPATPPSASRGSTPSTIDCRHHATTAIFASRIALTPNSVYFFPPTSAAHRRTNPANDASHSDPFPSIAAPAQSLLFRTTQELAHATAPP